jgi:hypothetical protein
MNTNRYYAEVLCIMIFMSVFSVTLNADPPGWGDDVRLTFAIEHSIEPELVIDSNDTIYVIWQDLREGNYNLYLKRSSDFGGNWSDDIKITDTLEESGWPRVALDSNDTLHMIWLEEDESQSSWNPYDGDYKQILYKKSEDGGDTWIGETQIVSNTGRMQQIGLDMAIGRDDAIHVAYSKYSPSEIYYRNSTDYGVSWSSSKLIGSDRDCARPVVIGADRVGHVYIAFHAWDDTGDIQYTRSDDNGDTWSSPTSLLGGNGWAVFCYFVTSDSGLVAITYCDNYGVGSDPWSDPREVYIMISHDNGLIWGPRIRLTHDDGQVFWPHTVLDSSNNFNIVWYDNRDGNWEIYYTLVDIGGNTIIDDLRLTDDPGSSIQPEIELDSNGTCHVFWADNRVDVDNHEIFYKGILSPPVADAGLDQTVNVGDEVHFNGSGSYNPDGNITFYEWDFDATDGIWWETGSPPDAFGPQPNHTYFDYGVYVATLRVTDNDGFMDTDSCEITVLLLPPSPPVLYINSSLDGNNVTLTWEPPNVLGLSHYLIYRATSQTNFDFTTVWKDTSIDFEAGEANPTPLRTIYNDTNAAVLGDPNYNEQYYYTIRAMNAQGARSSTSRTVGKWTKTFPSGISTFSLPLEPIETMSRNADFYVSHMNARYIKWLDPITHVWIKHGEGQKNDAQLEVGRGYVACFDLETNYSFCGMPAGMISYDDDNGFSGFDHLTEAKSLDLFVDPDGDVILVWEEPVIMSGGWYEVYYSNARDGFFGELNTTYFMLDSPLDFGFNSAFHSGACADDPGARLYYMVVPFNETGIKGASTYSMGIWTEEYWKGYDTIGIPLKLNYSQCADWFCDNIDYTMGINYFNVTYQEWWWHSTAMPMIAFDPVLKMVEGYQISTSSTTKFTFIGV